MAEGGRLITGMARRDLVVILIFWIHLRPCSELNVGEKKENERQGRNGEEEEEREEEKVTEVEEEEQPMEKKKGRKADLKDERLYFQYHMYQPEFLAMYSP